MLESLVNQGMYIVGTNGYIHILYQHINFSSRSQDDGLCEMTCTLSIQEELLTKPLAYKYVVFSPKMREFNDCYEFLHSFVGHSPNPNRCLHIEKAKHHPNIGGN